jgi:hypothetical protein
MPHRTPAFQHPEGLIAHYTTASAAFEHILPARRLKLNPYRKMRDPTENRDFAPLIGLRGAPGTDVHEVVQGVIRELAEARDSVRLASFTAERPVADDGPLRASVAVFNCAWYRPRMWEQYGGDHRGVCLLFDRDRLVAEINQRLPPTLDARHVIYTPEGIAGMAAFFDNRVLDPATHSQAIADYIDAFQEGLFFRKSDDFATEFEFRIVLSAASTLPEPSEDEDYEIDADGAVKVGYGDALVAVVVGHEFPNWQIDGAVKACDRAQVRLGKLAWQSGRPSVRLLGDGHDNE